MTGFLNSDTHLSVRVKGILTACDTHDAVGHSLRPEDRDDPNSFSSGAASPVTSVTNRKREARKCGGRLFGTVTEVVTELILPPSPSSHARRPHHRW